LLTDSSEEYTNWLRLCFKELESQLRINQLHMPYLMKVRIGYPKCGNRIYTKAIFKENLIQHYGNF
jgi:hypothetical protein